jgi:glycosyltransferase involved in cell wall biosynthesis
MIKILIIVPRFGTIHRGLETYVKELISNIDKFKFDITVLSAEHVEIFESVNFQKYNIQNREKFDGIFKYKVMRKILSYFNIYGSSDFEALSLMYESKDFLKNNHFDIILPFGGFWSFFILNKLIDRQKTKIISVGHASVVKKEILQSDYFVALTQFAYEEAGGVIDKDKIILIPNGVDTNKFNITKNNDAKNTILCVAAFSSDKNHISLLNAISLMSKDIKLVLVGKGPLENDLKQHPACKTHDVIFKSVTLEEMPLIYKEASIFTLASPEEAFGIVFLEALASGLNVVAHDAPRQKYVVGESGFYCDVFDAKEYAKTLEKALSLKQEDRNVSQAQKFSWQAIALEYEKFFSEVVDAK